MLQGARLRPRRAASPVPLTAVPDPARLPAMAEGPVPSTAGGVRARSAGGGRAARRRHLSLIRRGAWLAVLASAFIGTGVSAARAGTLLTLPDARELAAARQAKSAPAAAPVTVDEVAARAARALST